MDRREATPAPGGMFLPVADAAQSAVVIAPTAARSLFRHDSREELWRGDDADARRAESSKRPRAGGVDAPLPWPSLSGVRAVKGASADGNKPLHRSRTKPAHALSEHKGLVGMELRVDAARRVYETLSVPAIAKKKKKTKDLGRARTPPSLVALDPLEHMKSQQHRVARQQSELSKAVETRIDNASRALPVQFLLERENRRMFAERVVLQAMCHVLRAHYARVTRVAWYVWKKRTLTLRILEEHERKLFLLRQTCLAHACAIVQLRIHSRLRAVLIRWKGTTDKMRWHEQMYGARRIQKCWRAWRMQRKLKTLALQYRERVRHDSAVCIQLAVRRFLARCEMARFVWAHRRHIAATRIQSAYRNYVVLQIAKHHRQMSAAVIIQRIWRGRAGRLLVQHRRQSIRDAVVCVFESSWLGCALVSVLHKHFRATQIQRMCRAFMYRRQIRVGVRRSWQRRHHLPACCIQQVWHGYRSHRIRMVVEGVVFRVMMTHMSAARRIQHCFRTHWAAKTANAALILTRLMSCFSAKRRLIQRYVQPTVEEWQATHFRPWWAACEARSESAWCRLLTSTGDSISRFDDDQRSASCRLNVHEALRLLLQLKQFEHDFVRSRARQIQFTWRLHRLRGLVAELRRASVLLQRAIPSLYRQHKRRKQRQRVLDRWRRRRYVELHTCFEILKMQYLVRVQARDLATTTRNVRKALWFHHHKLRQSIMRRWKDHVLHRRAKRRKLEAAIRHASLSMTRTVWCAWKSDALPNICCGNILHELAMALTVWKTWNAFVERKRLSRRARQHHHHHLKIIAIASWKQDQADFIHELDVADSFHRYHVKRQAFRRLACHTAKANQVRAQCRRNLQMYGLRHWFERVFVAQRYRQSLLTASTFRKLQLAKSSWSQWTRYCRHQSLQRAKRRSMEIYYEKRRARQVVGTWSQELMPMWRDYHLILSVAAAYRARRLKERYFRQGFRVFWELTAGARRVAMATRIQRMFRGKRARMRIVLLRLKIRHQLETRATSAKDTCDFTTSTLQAALKSHEWVFALFSLPWAPIQAQTKEAFGKTATTWSFIRNQATRMMFGFVNAAETIQFPSHDFSLMTWFGIQPERLPCVVGFWQGVGPAPSSTDQISRLASGKVLTLKRRFKKVCNEELTNGPSLMYLTSLEQVDPSQPFTMSRLVSWIERLQYVSREAAAIDLQSYIRGYLARRRTKRYRIVTYERRKQRVRGWCRKLIESWKNTKRQKAATVLQRWIRHFQARHKFWLAFWREVRLAKDATQRVQRAAIVYLNRLRTRRATKSFLATPQRYPEAPLCQVCDFASPSLGRLRCRDCDQLLCAGCFSKSHKSGKRLLHLCDSIDFEAFNDPSANLCPCCESHRSSRLCSTCDVLGSQACRAFCTSCFEIHHTDQPKDADRDGTSRRTHRKSWWESTAFQQHEWKRVYGSVESMVGTVCVTALSVMEKNAWQSWNTLIRKQHEAVKAEESARDREEKLLAIRVQQEAILRDAFDRFDIDKSGAIDQSEFKRMFKEELCEPLSDEQANEAMKCMDKSGNGLIEFDELLAWFAEDILAKEESGAKDQPEPRSLMMLKDALRAKRKMRRYKEKLNEFVPTVNLHVPRPVALTEALSQLTEKKAKKKLVPGFPSVECIEHSDFARKRRVFYRFVQEICGLDWIFEDEAMIPVANAMEVFDKTFVPRWNAGELTYDFYFDDESFEFEGEVWQRQWVAETKKYVFTTTRRKTRKVEVTSDQTGNKKRRKRSSLLGRRGSTEVQTMEVEETVQVVELVDPRRKQMLLEEAQEAFKKADVDGSGYIDEYEFHRMLTRELCEPVPKSKAKQIMKQLDADGSGKIDFHEFFQWYAAEKCQDYPMTPQMARARALLQTRRRAKATAAAALEASVSGGIQLKQALDRKRKERQLARDCKGASPELIELLQEGYAKPLAEKALTLHNQDVIFARQWLRDKQQSEQLERDQAARDRAARKARAKKEAREKKQKRRQRMAAMRTQIKLLLIGPSKKEAHTARMQLALSNLDREIQLVERQLAAQ